METTFIDPALCHPNRYQPADRIHFTPDQLTDLESIREKLLMPPKVRPHPEHPGEYEICYGHRRTAAWTLYRPGELMPAYVESLTDFDLFAEQAIENGQRQNLNAIDKALTVQIAMKQFGKTQLEAGKLVGLTTQPSVSHLLSLLKLPEDVRTLVAEGKIAERQARALLSAMRTLGEHVITQTARQVAVADPSAKDALLKFLLSKAEELSKSQPQRKDKAPMSHKSAHARRPPTEKPPLPPKVRKEIAAMAQAAAAEISSSNPQRDVILKAIESLCRRWKVGLPKNWAGPTNKRKES